MPTPAEVPPIEVLLTEDAPSPLYLLGVKGAITAAGAAIAAAVDDAIGRPGAITALPITPQRLHAALHRRPAAGSGPPCRTDQPCRVAPPLPASRHRRADPTANPTVGYRRGRR